MQSLNYHHLLYFWTVAREGSIAKASAELQLTQPTISEQIRALENSIGEKLFRKAGRNLVLTEVGKTTFDYAERIFSLGNELRAALRGIPAQTSQRIAVGITNDFPHALASLLLGTALTDARDVRLACRKDRLENLLSLLATGDLDLVLSDMTLPPAVKVKAFAHSLGKCSVRLFAPAKIAAKYKKSFPKSLDGAPFVIPTSAAKRPLEHWFEEMNIRPRVMAESADVTLTYSLGASSNGLFAAPAALEADLKKQHGVVPVGEAKGLTAEFYLVSVERRLTDPFAAMVQNSARKLFRSK